jgi:hypothetical protein
MKSNKLIDDIQIPDFKNYIRKLPYNKEVCKEIDSNRLLVEMLELLKPADEEFKDSDLSSKLLLD